MIKKLLDQAYRDGDVLIIENALMCWKRSGNEVWTGTAWVHPDHRRKGLCTELARRVASMPGAEWLCSKTMKNRPDVTAMYAKMGRNIVREDDEHYYWRDRVEDII